MPDMGLLCVVEVYVDTGRLLSECYMVVCN